MPERTAGLRLGDFTEGGGLLDNADVTWTGLEFVMWDYNGTVAPVPALKITMDTGEGEAVEYFSCGKASDWKPSDDGKKLIAIGSAEGINKSSKVGLLIKSLIDCGFPEDRIGDDCTVFAGLRCHMIRVEDKRTGLPQQRAPRADGKTFERTRLVVDTIHKLPWDSGGRAKGEANDPVAQEATDVIMQILSEHGMLSKKELAPLVFKATKSSKNKNAIWKLSTDDNFLSSGPWQYEDGTLAIGG